MFKQFASPSDIIAHLTHLLTPTLISTRIRKKKEKKREEKEKKIKVSERNVMDEF